MSEIEIPMCSAGHVCVTCRDGIDRRAMAEAGQELSARLAERDAAFPPSKPLVDGDARNRRRGRNGYAAYQKNDGSPVFDADGKRIGALPPLPSATLMLANGRKIEVRPSGYPPTEEQAALKPSSSSQGGSWVYEKDSEGVTRLVRAGAPTPTSA